MASFGALRLVKLLVFYKDFDIDVFCDLSLESIIKYQK